MLCFWLAGGGYDKFHYSSIGIALALNNPWSLVSFITQQNQSTVQQMASFDQSVISNFFYLHSYAFDLEDPKRLSMVNNTFVFIDALHQRWNCRTTKESSLIL